MHFNVAVVKWDHSDELSDAFTRMLNDLGHNARSFFFQDPFPADSEIVFTFGPYGRWYPIARQVGAYPAQQKPVLIHWNTENIPNPGLPWPLMYICAMLRSRQDSLYSTAWPWLQKQLARPGSAKVMDRFKRYRYLGDYHSAYNEGWLDLLYDTSVVFTRFHQAHGLPAHYGSWGSIPGWYTDLDLQRDIDVLWMGNRRTRRRSALIDKVSATVLAKGGSFLACDNKENPFIYGDTRKNILNRSKITLNILAAARHDNILPFRFALAAANGSLVISEAELPHCPNLKPEIHYVVSNHDEFPARVLYYLEHEEERGRMVNAARRLVASDFQMQNTLAAMVEQAGQVYERRFRNSLVYAS